MTAGVWVLGDRLWQNQAAFNRSLDDISSLPVILIESWQHVQQRPYHRQKLVLIWSAEHFAEELRGAGCQVTYTTSGDFETPLKAWIQAHQITDLRVLAPDARPFLQLVQNWSLD